MKVLIKGLPHEEAEDGPPDTWAREECEATWDTADDCLVIDVLGTVLLNTTGVTVDEVSAT